jgi:hypothetical protein
MKNIDKISRRMNLIRKVQDVYSYIITRLMQVCAIGGFVILVVLFSDISLLTKYADALSVGLFSLLGFMVFMNVVDATMNYYWRRLFKRVRQDA